MLAKIISTQSNTGRIFPALLVPLFFFMLELLFAELFVELFVDVLVELDELPVVPPCAL